MENESKMKIRGPGSAQHNLVAWPSQVPRRPRAVRELLHRERAGERRRGRLREGTKTLKSLKFYHKITTKSTNAVVAMVRNARCRSTCEHASKRVDFCRSRCCFAHAMDAKFVQNRRKSSMATCNLSTVVPAARRANSKCILLKKMKRSTEKNLELFRSEYS